MGRPLGGPTAPGLLGTPRSLTPPQDRGTEQRSQSEFPQPYLPLGPVETMRRVASALRGNMSVSHGREIINIKPHG